MTLKSTAAFFAARTLVIGSSAAAQTWETGPLPKEEGIAAQSMNSDAADILIWCSEEVPGITIGLPLTPVPHDIAERMTLFVDGEELRNTLGFELNPAETGVWLNGDANAQWGNVRWMVEKIASGDRLTVMVPSLGFATNFDLRGARDAIAPVAAQCGLGR